MAKSKLSELKEEAENTEVVARDETPTAVIPVDAAEGLSGEWGQDDIALPRLNVVAKTGPLSNQFNPGEIVLNKEVVLVPRDTPIICTVLDMRKQWQEELEYGGDEMPATFETLAEARQQGFSKEWGSANRVRPLAHLRMLVVAPEGVRDDDIIMGEFPYELPGDELLAPLPAAMVVMSVAKTAFDTTAKFVFSHVALGGGENKMWDHWWDLKSVLKSSGDNTWFSPHMKKGRKLTESELEFVAGLR